MNCIKNIYLIIICTLLFSTIAHAHGGKKMESTYLYEINDFKSAQSLLPKSFSIGGYRNVSIFPVPHNNAVGSNDMGNAITIISFPKGKIDYDKYFHNAEDIIGSGKYMPPISQDLIGFGQERVFHLFDFKRKIYRKYRIVFPVTQYIEKIAIADAKQRHFLFEIESQKPNTKDPLDVNSYLQLLDLTGDSHKLIKEIDIGKSIWTTTKDRVFVYNLESEQLQVLDLNLEPAHHPLKDVIRQNKAKISFSRIYIHQSLPFAVLRGKKGAVYIGWGKDKNTVPHLLISGASQFAFSPDGKWLILKYDRTGPAKTFIMPVSEKYPYYLGSPILISDESFPDRSGSWTTNPTGFVGTSLDRIYHWDLENQDYPGKGKMSFHDYIVQEDMKKLTREKRQGLGK
ncbi:hypothetical protein [Pelotalea chapellei]|uniref:Methanethiol oxidase n=1 Tax=Pelotalea chapellei TaxID=44671 RepID=A0ABS5UAS5_9BACT|nr:hypothetical protein [Pelotalea chapellei]MBT1072764.1 hypothetical protein [Pelotalea chapellei]